MSLGLRVSLNRRKILITLNIPNIPMIKGHNASGNGYAERTVVLVGGTLRPSGSLGVGTFGRILPIPIRNLRGFDKGIAI